MFTTFTAHLWEELEGLVDLFGTLHTFVYRFDQKTFTTSSDEGGETITIDFDQWVKGRDIEISAIRGYYHSGRVYI
ncbi:hypothetical protein NDK47_10115 [Brevibacillus ruminantium]|uniref:Uncharacterized protein n=1 Tax=Brevibacillus ruminantium TaxID=2950604 RepID=A0ABY4WP09_9BACL|nr:hypothetical protein [Brevibacillus ruminantium]USG67600.1 hypothetical protein NDK47_10115 [Brevibacillus ruminantium]